MARINFEILAAGAIDCLEEDCALKGKCANHHSARDFRMETGMTPQIYIRDGFLECSKLNLTDDEGMVELVVSKYKPF